MVRLFFVTKLDSDHYTVSFKKNMSNLLPSKTQKVTWLLHTIHHDVFWFQNGFHFWLNLDVEKMFFDMYDEIDPECRVWIAFISLLWLSLKF